MTGTGPIPLRERTPLIDVLRGWALLSVVLINYSTIHGWNTHKQELPISAWSEAINKIIEFLFAGKGWALLAILFGYGFSVLLKNFNAANNSRYAFFSRRMLWLFVFAFFNSILFGGDILNDYAFLGLVMILFYKLSARSLFVVSAVILVMTPFLQSYLGNLHILFSPKDRDMFYELYGRNNLLDNIKANLFMRYKWLLRLSYLLIAHLVQLGCILLGAALHRSNYLVRLSTTDRPRLRMLMIASFLLSIGIYCFQLLVEWKQWTFNKYYNLYYPQIISITIFISVFITWLYSAGKAEKLFMGMQTIGRMTLTNYILQNLFAFIVFICIRPGWSEYQYWLSALIVYALQVVFSNWWLQSFNYGPLEWAWRSLSYGKKVAWRKRE